MIDFLKNIDISLFLFINRHNNEFADTLMYDISKGFIWIPVFMLFIYLIIKQHRKKSLWILLFAALLITSTDQISVHLFKNIFMRLRPCHEPSLDGLVHIVKGHCGGQFGFISSHAANYFGVSLFIIIVSGIKNNWFRAGILLWASLICYSRIYLGVHYPADVFAGAITGSLLGLGWGFLALHVVNLKSDKIRTTN